MDAKRILKTIIAFLILFVGGYLLHTSVLSNFAIGVVTPNVLLLVTAAVGFMHSSISGMIMGFLCGIMMDCYYPEYFGVNCLIFLVIGYLNGLFSKFFYGDDIRLPLLLVGGSDIIYGTFIYLFLFFGRGRFDAGFYYMNIIIPETIYTLVIFLIIYFPLLKFIRWSDKESGRNRNAI